MASTRMPKASARWATSRPVPPKPTIPIVCSKSSRCSLRMGSRSDQSFRRIAVWSPRVRASSSAKACSDRCTPTWPFSLATITSLSTSSGVRIASTPAPIEW